MVIPPKLRGALIALALLAVSSADFAHPDLSDPLDPFESSSDEITSTDDAAKTPTQLILEAQLLMADERLLDARTKLLRALEKDPKQYRAHYLLANYYSVHVGHFRLAARYAQRALDLFAEQHGKPPYWNFLVKEEHQQLLYVLSQVTLDLDDYPGALKVLDDFEALGYSATWYAGTRAWILMKLGRIDEAIALSKKGLAEGAEAGRTLNMLGILLSMNGEREASLQIFKEAVRHEMSLGSMGQPATPLNNTGEVYKEMFDDKKAETSWLRATSMPDGCEHVLPALNLAILYMEQANYQGASQAMDTFLSCVAQYPLRNGEEHRALVHLARGRIALHTGFVDRAINHLSAAIERRQWFGKIGTNAEDLEAAATIALSHAYTAKANQLSRGYAGSWREYVDAKKESALLRVQAWWLLRKGTRLLTEKLANFEDIYIRNTDSLLEYQTLGTVTSRLPAGALKTKIEQEKQKDQRPEAQAYYTAYLGENYLHGLRKSVGIEYMQAALKQARPGMDDALRAHLCLTLMASYSVTSEEYRWYAQEAYKISKADIWNYGLQLPVNFEGDGTIRGKLSGTAFYVDDSAPLPQKITGESRDGEWVVSFIASGQGAIPVTVKGNDLPDVINKLMAAVFQTELEATSQPQEHPKPIP